jgi:hypothetical protein
MPGMSARTRGRPQKFGRPARVVALTLPDDVVEWLRSIHHDLGWAVVSLFEGTVKRAKRPKRPPAAQPAELVQLSGRRALIVVDPGSFKGMAAVSIIPLANGRAFLALADGRGMADLELAIGDRLEAPGLSEKRRRELEALKAKFREWRHTPGLTFHSRSIIVAARARRARAESARTLKHPSSGSQARRSRS